MITKKHIFERKLANKPVKIFVGSTSMAEIDLLIECGVIVIDREQHGKNVGIVGYMVELLEGNPVYRTRTKHPGEFISFRR